MNKKFNVGILTIFGVFFMLKSLLLYAADDINKQPSMAFLEYLANQIEVEGTLIGPIDMKSSKIKSSSDDSPLSNSQKTTKKSINKDLIKNAENERGSQ